MLIHQGQLRIGKLTDICTVPHCPWNKKTSARLTATCMLSGNTIDHVTMHMHLTRYTMHIVALLPAEKCIGSITRAASHLEYRCRWCNTLNGQLGTRPLPPWGLASPHASGRPSHRGRLQPSRPRGRQQQRNRENKRRTTAKTKILLLSSSSSLKFKSMITGLRVWIRITIMISWCLSTKDSSNYLKPSLLLPPQLRKTKRVSKSLHISTKKANRRQR